MITIPPQIPQSVQKIQVSSKDPHHTVGKEKKKKNQNHDDEHGDVEDKITLSDDAKHEAEQVPTKKAPDSPMQGHINIDA